jgi:hypothetical protein
MDIDTCCEFGYELQLVIPYAYYLHMTNQLNSTTSSEMTKELYYFSQNHSEKYKVRKYENPNVPNKTPHVTQLDYSQYLVPEYKSIYKNAYYVFDKPLLIIHNKYTTEWHEPPINYLNIATLRSIFEMCNAKYKIIYINPNSDYIINDSSNTMRLEGEEELLKQFSITTGNKLYLETKNKYNVRNFNHFQLLIHSNCDSFISVQGGNSVLASYFGGTNLVFARKGAELDCGAYNTHYRCYSGARVEHANNYQGLLQLVESNYLNL